MHGPRIAIAAQPRQPFFESAVPLVVLQRAQQIARLLLRFFPFRDRGWR